MPKFEVSDGQSRYEIEAPDENAALAAFNAFKGNASAARKSDAVPGKPESEYGISDAVRGISTGVPVVGGLLNKLNAATNATLAPVLNPFFSEEERLKGETLGDRYSESLAAQEAKDKQLAEEHPAKNMAANIVGGVAGTIPAVLAAPRLFGAVGSLPQMVRAGAGSGAALSGADALTRGENIPEAAAVGGVTGAAAPLVGRAIGAAVDAVRPKPVVPPVPVNTVNIAGETVPLRPSQVTGDAAESMNEQAILKGSRGEAAQRIAQTADEEQALRMQAASSRIADDLAPGGPAGTSPGDAAERVSTELTAAETAEQARLRGMTAATEAEQEALRGRLNPGGGAVVADDPFSAGEMLGTGVRRRAEEARLARTAAYDAVRDVEGEFRPRDWENIGQNLRQRLGRGDNPVIIDDTVTPLANRALTDLEENVGSLRFQNRMRPNSQTRLTESGERVADPITGRDIDQARKRVLALRPDAVAKARMGNGSDLRALDSIIRAFDDRLETVVRNGHFSGNGADFLNRLREARRLHGEYRRLYSPQGPSDSTGSAVQKIVGRYEGQQSTPDEIVKIAYGQAGDPGGGNAARVAERMREIFGENSTEWAGYKQGLFAQLIDNPAGTAARTPEQIAARIERFLDGNNGRVLADVAFTPAERDALRNFAAAQRGLIRAAPRDAVERVMAHISGRDGMPATPGQVVDYLYASQGKRGMSVLLAGRLRRDLTPEAFNMVKQGMWSKLISPGEGMIEFGPQKLSQRLHDFLDNSGRDMARILFSPAERAQMRLLADTYRRMIPVTGTVPHGSAPMLAKLADQAKGNILAMLGGTTGGPAGLAIGWASDRIVKRASDRKGAREAVRAFYGEQPRVATPRRDPLAAVAIGQSAGPLLSNQR